MALAESHQSLLYFYRHSLCRKSVSCGSSNLTKSLSMAGFNPIIYGRFWVITEDYDPEKPD